MKTVSVDWKRCCGARNCTEPALRGRYNCALHDHPASLPYDPGATQRIEEWLRQRASASSEG